MIISTRFSCAPGRPDGSPAAKDPLIYLDNAATSFPKPPAVWEAVRNGMLLRGGNAGRGSHVLSAGAAADLFSCREEAARLFHTRPDRVIFTWNATSALNMAIKGLIPAGRSRPVHVVCSDMEHNAVYRPLYRLAAEGIIRLDTFPTFPASPDRSDEAILRALDAVVRADTCMVVCAHASNICSAVLPVAGIGRFCRERGIRFVVDAAQSAGILPVDVAEIGADAVCMPGHKGLFGPQGTGLLLLGENAHPDTLIEGGNGMDSLLGAMSDDPPERYEAGTLPAPLMAGLGAGMRFVRSVGVENIRSRETALGVRLTNRLRELPAVTLYAPARAGGTVLFSMAGYDSEAVGRYLDRCGICVRAGFHCTALGHRTLRTPADGAVRASMGYFNTEADVDALSDALGALPEKRVTGES